MAKFKNVCTLDMECPREIVVWNYYDHEHVVGTHYKYYDHFKVIAEQDDWCLVQRYYKLPLVGIRTSSVGFMWRETDHLYRSIQFGKLGMQFHQQIVIEDLPND